MREISIFLDFLNCANGMKTTSVKELYRNDCNFLFTRRSISEDSRVTFNASRKARACSAR